MKNNRNISPFMKVQNNDNYFDKNPIKKRSLTEEGKEFN